MLHKKIQETPFKRDVFQLNQGAAELEAKKSFCAERFKQTVQWLMEDRNISEIELSRLTNLSPATIHRLIYGTTDPRLSTLRAIATFFQIRIEQLIGDYPIPTVTQVDNETAEKIFFAPPILIPFIEWEQLIAHVNTVNELTMNNWANWHAITNDSRDEMSVDFFATKLNYTAGNLLQAESILIVKSFSSEERLKIGDCLVGQNEKGSIFVGQVSGSGDELVIKGGGFLRMDKCKIFGLIIKCEAPFAKISRYTSFI